MRKCKLLMLGRHLRGRHVVAPGGVLERCPNEMSSARLFDIGCAPMIRGVGRRSTRFLPHRHQDPDPEFF